MPVTTSRLREPIIIFRLTGECTGQDIEALFRERLVFLEETRHNMVYSITDLSKMDASDDAMHAFFRAAGEKRPGTARDNRVVPLLVGGAHCRAVELYRKATSKPGYRGLLVPVFDNVNQAVGFARWQIFLRSSNTR